MSDESLETIAILGAGPLGLEAALYARFLGYNVRIYESRRVAENVLRWGHVRMFSPFALNCSPLGRAALHAQDPDRKLPADEILLTGQQWAEQYLIPISQTDLLAEHLQQSTEVLGVTRWDARKGEHFRQPERDDSMFRILVRDADGHERADSADIVIDATGVFAQPNWIGPGGGPALGELGLRNRIEYQLPDPLGRDRKRYAGQRTLLVGSGYSAATSAVALTQLAEQAPGTSVVWLSHRWYAAAPWPLKRIAQDRLPARDELAAAANQLAGGGSGALECRPGWQVWSLQPHDAGFDVRLGNPLTDEECSETFDAIVANVGYHPCVALYGELHVHACYVTDGPMKLAASLMKNPSADCLDQASPGPEVLATAEPSFYVLGAKSYGRNSNFLFSVGLQQIRDIFTVIGERADLDLYATARMLPQ
jgi:thioredoxin reductase